MGQRIDQFCEDLRVKLTSIADSGTALKAAVEQNETDVVNNVRDRLDAVDTRLKAGKQHVLDANDRAKAWGESKRLDTHEQVASWKQKREIAKLERRAESAETYAADVAVIALASIDEAESAALEAWLARLDADLAKVV